MKPTDKELEVLQVLWSKGPSKVRDVHEVLARDSDAGYTTTLKIMQIMHEKGILSRERSGKTHIYSSLVSESVTRKKLVERLVDTAFQGSAASMVLQLLDGKKYSTEELNDIRNFLDQIDKQK